MQKVLTGILLLTMISSLNAQSWTPASPNIYFTGGNVGIGTSTPLSRLQIHTPGSGADDHDALSIQNPSGAAWSNVQLALTTGSGTPGTSVIFSQRQDQTGGSNLSFWTSDINAALHTRMLITSDGNVGIGGTPSYKLDISSAALNDGIRLASTTGSVVLHSNNMGSFAFNQLTQQGDAGLIYGNSSNVVNFGFVIAPWNNASAGLRMDNAGNVGIGTSSTGDAGYKLFVETGIRTRKITVDQSAWPDYVFHPNYSLPSLSSVATYIKDNGHLPDVPSADSVAKSGVDLGDNQAVLLKKIEELTLYTIDQDNTLRQQAQKLEDIESTMQEQQRIIETLKKEIEKKAK